MAEVVSQLQQLPRVWDLAALSAMAPEPSVTFTGPANPVLSRTPACAAPLPAVHTGAWWPPVPATVTPSPRPSLLAPRSRSWGNSDLFSLGGDQGIDILSATTAVDRIVGEDARNKT